MAKITPQIGNFVSTALGAGYAMNEIIDYITGIFSNPGATTARARMQQKQQQGTARSDEEAILNQLHQSDIPGKLAGAVPAIAGKAALPLTAIANIPAAAQGLGNLLGGGGAASQGAVPPQTPTPPPFQQAAQTTQAIGRAAAPIAQAYKATEGLSTPVISGRAIAEAEQAMGKLKGNASRNAVVPQKSIQSVGTPFDMFKKDQPKLGAFLESEVSKGKNAFEAAAAARKKASLKVPIADLEEKMGQPFEGVVAQVFGYHPKGNEPELMPTQNVPQQGQASPDWMAAQNQALQLIDVYNKQHGMR